MTKRVTLRDLSAVTGLHFSTIGLALRNDPRVNSETAARIKAAASDLGYRRDPLLSALSSYRHQQGTSFRGVVALLAPAPVQRLATTQFGTALVYEAIRPMAADMGFKIECIDVSEPGLTGARLTQILLSRGIPGLILAPIPKPGAYLDIEWRHFCTVALGYSVQSPTHHRACPHQARSMSMNLQKLRSLGYERIGIILSRNGNVRTDHNLLGAYLAEQKEHPASMHVEPYIFDQKEYRDVFDPGSIQAWLRRYRPDCVLGVGRNEIRLLESLGYSVPRDIGFSTYGWQRTEPEIAGVDERWDLLGATAMELLVELMKNREYGVPTYPRFAVVPSQWRDGNTVQGPRTAPAPGNVPPDLPRSDSRADF